MTPNVPTSDRGTATLGMMVAQTLRRKTKTTRITSTTEMSSVISTSWMEARMVMVRSRATASLMEGGMEARSVGQESVDAVDGVDDVGAGLAEEDEQHRSACRWRARPCDVFHWSLTTVATSPRRTGAPLR